MNALRASLWIASLLLAHIALGQATSGQAPKPTPEVRRLLDAAEKLEPKGQIEKLLPILELAQKLKDRAGEAWLRLLCPRSDAEVSGFL